MRDNIELFNHWQRWFTFPLLRSCLRTMHRQTRIGISLFCTVFLLAGAILADDTDHPIQTTADLRLIHPTSFQAFDTPNDAGGSISLRWPISPSDSPNVEYVIYFSKNKDGPFDREALRIKSNTNYKNARFHIATVNLRKLYPGEDTKTLRKTLYYFQLAMEGPSGKEIVTPTVSAKGRGNLFNLSEGLNLLIMLAFGGLVLYFIAHARRNPNIFLRKIGGLDAVEEALGRATEMGKPVLFVHGLTTMGSVSTIAAVNILGRIAGKIAEYDAMLKVVNNDPIVMSVSQEVVKEAYLEAGRPDAYNEDNIFLVASEQFPYVAAVSGIMRRERPATNFFIGYFYAESLILAETGAETGAIQIAGTDAFTQLPFFITTCDYTLMGEELYAASAYLSREPLLLGTLRAQD
ncbi:MAG: DUF6754 domain-containing protein, partial [Candidatus Brocadiales bacterium]